jgi:multimeric flavodoxin WrbA
MNICVISGSPKGEASNTFQYFRYIQRQLPAHRYSIVHIGREIGKIETDTNYFGKIVGEIKKADAVIWVYPVTYFLVPAGLKRFIELIFTGKAADAFAGKYATAITTSMHLFDHTSHAYIHGISEDLGMRYVPGYSAQFNDLIEEEERRQLILFAEEFMTTTGGNLPVERVYPPVAAKIAKYRPAMTSLVKKTGGFKILFLTDETPRDKNLGYMTDIFLRHLPNRVEFININDIRLSPCRNCLSCAYDGVCVIDDDMNFLYQKRILPADAIIYAGTVHDRYLSARWKLFFDRFFLNGHRPVLTGKQGGFIISGSLRELGNLRQLLTCFAETFGLNSRGVVTDEYKDPDHITGLLHALADRIMEGLEHGVRRPPSFLGVGGKKILRDINFSTRFIFTENHRYYTRHGLFDFPHSRRTMRLMGRIIVPLMRIEGFRKRFQAGMNEKMLAPLKKAAEE